MSSKALLSIAIVASLISLVVAGFVWVVDLLASEPGEYITYGIGLVFTLGVLFLIIRGFLATRRGV